MLGVVDNFDVASTEKSYIEACILKGSENKTNIIFLNNKMVKTLKNIMHSYNSGLLSTPNIQVNGKIFSSEIITFSAKLMADLTFSSSTFKNSNFINMKFINVNFESSFFEKCLIQNCIFENNILRLAEYDNCIFSNCFLIDCNLNKSD